MTAWGMFRSAKIGKGISYVTRWRCLAGRPTPRRRWLRKFIRVQPGCNMPAIVPRSRRNRPRTA